MGHTAIHNSYWNNWQIWKILHSWTNTLHEFKVLLNSVDSTE